jgi:hypothetical protein
MEKLFFSLPGQMLKKFFTLGTAGNFYFFILPSNPAKFSFSLQCPV